MWKDIEGYEGKYRISTEGEVLSVNKDLIMAQCLGGNGYLKTGLRRNGTKDRLITHRLVAQAFIPNPHNKPQVNHIDGNKLNNNAYNLEWCTPKENTEHAYRIGLRKGTPHNKGKKLGKSSQYHYVERVTYPKKGELFYRAVVKKGSFHRSKQFSIKKYGELEAECLAAKAANDLISQYPEFVGLALNVI